MSNGALVYYYFSTLGNNLLHYGEGQLHGHIIKLLLNANTYV